MSKSINAYLITPPLFPKESPVEREEYRGIKCSYCHGNGWFWKVDEVGERVKDPCPFCHGSKRMKAVLTLEWTADE